jgi:hypothetical protein
LLDGSGAGSPPRRSIVVRTGSPSRGGPAVPTDDDHCRVASVLGLAAGISLLFTSFGLGFCYMVGTSSLIGAGVLAFLPDGGLAAAITCLILLCEIIICWFILRVVSSRMVRRSLRK